MGGECIKQRTVCMIKLCRVGIMLDEFGDSFAVLCVDTKNRVGVVMTSAVPLEHKTSTGIAAHHKHDALAIDHMVADLQSICGRVIGERG